MHAASRRDFLRDSALLSAGIAVAGNSELVAEEPKKVAPADKLRVAVVGVRGRGSAHVGGFLDKDNQKGTVITTVCDCDTGVIAGAMNTIEKAQGKAPKFEQDIRKVVTDKDVDIISIATPNHWHSLMAIWAMQNGKDVYVEKPVSHNVLEGRRCVEAARKYNRICQTGTQSRSGKGLRDAMAFMHEGKLGKIKLAHGLCYKPRGSIGKVSGPQPIPNGIDYNLWCGPAPMKPLMRKNLHYDWHWIWDYGNGDLGNQGIHEMDKARWGLGKNELAKSVISIGGRFGYIDDGETANSQICVFDYGDCQLIFEVRGLKTGDVMGAKVGNIFYGTEGYMVVPNYSKATAYTLKGEKIKEFGGGEDHFGNFLKAVRSRNATDLNADILEGHLSSALCHLGNVSYRMGSTENYDKTKSSFGDNKEAADILGKMTEHLKDNGVALDKTPYRVGLKLDFDPKKETFIGNKDANKMLTREYRKGFEVPDKV